MSTSSCPTPTVSMMTSRAGGVEHQRRVRRRARQPAECPRVAMLRMKTPRLRVRLHADAIAEDRAAGERAGRIDREHADVCAGAKPRRDAIDERALAGAGRPVTPKR
jgi:hypothetical protein